MKKTVLFIVMTLFVLSASLVGNVSAQTKDAMRVKILDFNIRKSGEMAGNSAQPFADLILKEQPDLVALQEVDYMVSRSGNKDFLTELAALTGLFPVFAKAIETGGGEYGVAILSKFPVSRSVVEALPFPTGAKERRVALVCDIAFPYDLKLRFVSTHLDNSSDDVRLEMANTLSGSGVLSGNMPVLLCGDFNSKPSDNTIAVGMMKWELIGDNTNTFPGEVPASKIDYIFAYPSSVWKTNSYKVLTTKISDHCPLITEVEYIK